MRAKEFERWASKVGMPDGDDGCMIWLGAKNNCGYGLLWVEGRTELAHRLAYEHFVGPIPVGLLVLHKCDTPACCHPDHLFAGTVQQNSDDMVAKGRAARGEKRYNAKLTEANVRTIRALSQEGQTQIAISLEFGVDRTLISQIILGKIWSHVL